MKRYILGLDEGTTSARCICYDTLHNKICGTVSHTFELHYPQSGWVEMDANEIWANQFAAISELIAKENLDYSQIVGLGVTNQRETVIVWDKKTGKPVYNAIVWQCRRTSEFCEQLGKDSEKVEKIFQKTGLIVDAYFSASKIKWILDNVAGAREKAQRGQLCCGTVDTWIIYKLTKGDVFVTDASNASRTMLFNINTMCWDEELCEMFDIPLSMLAEVVDSNAHVGATQVFAEPIEICGICGDQQSALFGQTCFEKGDAKITYGTGCFILMNTGEVRPISKNNMLSTVGWKIDGKTTYALEGSIFNAGSSVQWLRDNLKFFSNSEDSDQFAQKAKDGNGEEGSDGVYVVPAFTGLGAPYWNQNARGLIIGLTRNTNRYHIARATLEAIAYSAKNIIDLMRKDAQVDTTHIAADGGASNNDFLMQFQSDILAINIIRPSSAEATALGAIYLCALGLGVFKDLNEVAQKWQKKREFSPKMDSQKVKKLYDGWKKAVSRSLDWQE